MLFVAVLLEGRLPSLDLHVQFLSFFPGDLFLGAMMAGLLTLAKRVRAQRHWYNSLWWHVSIQLFTLLAAGGLMYSEFQQGYYPTGAMLSPTKFYHHVGLYGVYGYAILATLVAVIFGSEWTQRFIVVFVLCLLPALVWACLVYRDAALTPEQARPKAANAHVANWIPFWEPGWWDSLTRR